MRFFWEVIKRVNKTEDEHKDQKIRIHTGLVKVLRLSNTRASHSDPKIARIMFHTIDSMYRYLKHQENLQSSIAIKNPKSYEFFSPPHLYKPTEPRLPVDLQVVPPDLQDIQPCPLKVWNYNEIGFDTNGNFNKMLCTYKFFTGDRIWSTPTDERYPFWSAALIFNRADGHCFIPPVVVHQRTHYSKYLRCNIPSDWVIHNSL